MRLRLRHDCTLSGRKAAGLASVFKDVANLIVGLSFGVTTPADAWDGKTKPSSADTAALFDATGMESAHKPFIQTPNTMTGVHRSSGANIRRNYRGNFFADLGQYYGPKYSALVAYTVGGVLTLTTAPTNGQTVTIGSRTYTFQTALTNVSGNVLIGSGKDAAAANLAAAISAGPGAGTLYAAATTAHALVTATAATGGLVTAQAINALTIGTVAVSTNAAGRWSAATLLPGLAAGADDGFVAFADGDWIVVANAGTYGFDGAAGAGAKTKGDCYIWNAGAFGLYVNARNPCPQLDIRADDWLWGPADWTMDRHRKLLRRAGRPYKGVAWHYLCAWHKDPEWITDFLWAQTDATRIKTFISDYWHTRVAAIAGHMKAQGVQIFQADVMNELFSATIDPANGTQAPCMRSFDPQFPRTGNTRLESAWHHAATMVGEWGLKPTADPHWTTVAHGGVNQLVAAASGLDRDWLDDQQQRILTLWQYACQIARYYFPTAIIGFNDYSVYGGHYGGSPMLQFTDLNGDVQTLPVFQIPNDDKKLKALEHALHILALRIEARGKVIVDAVKDAPLAVAGPDAQGLQSHLNEVNHLNLVDLSRVLSRLTWFRRADKTGRPRQVAADGTYLGIEPWVSELNMISDVFANQADASIVVGGSGGQISALQAFYPSGTTSNPVDLISAPVPWTTNAATTAGLLRDAITAGAGTHGFTAAIDTGSTVRVRQFGQVRGFSLGSVVTGGVTAACSGGKIITSGSILSPGQCPPQFQRTYLVSSYSASGRKTFITIGRSASDLSLWAYSSRYAETWLKTLLTWGRANHMRIWRSDSGTEVFEVNDVNNQARTPLWDVMQRMIGLAKTLPRPSQRAIPNIARIRPWAARPQLTTSGGVSFVSTPICGMAVTASAAVATVPWSWFARQGLVANDCTKALQWVQGHFPAAGAVFLELWTDVNNRVSLYFKNNDGRLWMRSIVNGAPTIDQLIGLVPAGEVALVAWKLSPTGLRASLNRGAVVAIDGAVPACTTQNFGSDWQGLNGAVGIVLRHEDTYAAGEIVDDGALQATPLLELEVNPDPYWDGTGSFPPLTDVGAVGTPSLPGAPTGITEDLTYFTTMASVKLTFTDHPASLIPGHLTQVQTAVDVDQAPGGPVTIVSGVPVAVPGLVGTTLYARLRSINAHGFGPWSAWLQLHPNQSFTDSFDRADEALTASGSWAKDPSNGTDAMAVRSNGVQVIAAGTTGYLAPDLGPSPNVYVEVVWPGTVNSNALLAVLDYIDSNNFIGVCRSTSNANKFDVVQYVGGVKTILATSATLAGGETVRVERAGATARGLVNGVAIGTGFVAIDTAAGHLGTRHGLLSRGTTIQASPAFASFTCGNA